MFENLAELITRHIARSTACYRSTFTIERGQGETYRDGNWTLYAHGTYPRGSVLAGQPSRTFVTSTDNTDEGREALESACKEAKITAEVIGGTSFIPASVICDAAGLHDDDDSDW
jgi:hypothetical protein